MKNNLSKRSTLENAEISASENREAFSEMAPARTSAQMVTTNSAASSNTVSPLGCKTARFAPFGFKITARPGHEVRLASRGWRRMQDAKFFMALTHV